MTLESHIETESVLKYAIETLGYERLTNSQFNRTHCIIPSSLMTFVERNNPNQWKKMVSDFKGDLNALQEALMTEVGDFVCSNHNVAIFLEPRRQLSFKFQNKYDLVLYRPTKFGQTDQNIFNVINQVPIEYQSPRGKEVIVVDVGWFVNGILFSLLELKAAHTNQSAKKEGRGKVINNLLSILQDGVFAHLQNSTTPLSYADKQQLLSKKARAYLSPIHLVAMDTKTAYVLRGANHLVKDIEQFSNSGKANDADIKNQIQEGFFEDVTAIKEKDNQLSSEALNHLILHRLYAKDVVQREILYYNILGYERKKRWSKKGRKIVENRANTAKLLFPRPNQRYAVEIILQEALKNYKHEQDPDYFLQQLMEKLNKIHGLSEERRQNELKKRLSFANDKNMYTMLLQYAAGFGKTYIICWLALILKDMIAPNSSDELLFDKILLIFDRVDLRDQGDTAMYNMNVEKAVFHEANTTKQLKEHLLNKETRIIIVNIQKFNFTEFTELQRELLRNKRCAFIIDEIHRSNSGSQHQEMVNLFNSLADEIAVDTAEHQRKKNMIIGLTATPTQEALARFGEYQACLEDIKWIPFDSYTTLEAIRDGFVIDPTKNILPVAVQLAFEDNSSNLKDSPTKEAIYDSDDRIIKIAEHIVQSLYNTTYKKIRGTGKGMLACASITAAKKYYDAIKKITQEYAKDPKYAMYQHTPVYIVYTGVQDSKKAHILCEYTDPVSGRRTFKDEKEVIADFKNTRNGLIIVVDKLQTGFDEPRLHTLFLDKEIRGISAVQTVSRVNRTTKSKEDCLVLDYSDNNVNIKNIKEAFRDFEGLVVGNLDPISIAQEVEELYRAVLKTETYKTLYSHFSKEKENTSEAYIRQDYVHQAFQNEADKKQIIRECEDFMTYCARVGLIDNIQGVADKYRDPLLVKFLREMINLIRQELNGDDDDMARESLDFWVENIGIVDLPVDLRDPTEDKKTSQKVKLTHRSEIDRNEEKLLERLREEKYKGLLIEEYRKNKTQIFQIMADFTNQHQPANAAVLRNASNQTFDDLLQATRDAYKAVCRGNRIPDEKLRAFAKDMGGEDGDYINLWMEEFIPFV